MNNLPMMMQQFMNFAQSYRGNPQAQVQQMLTSGQISQQQFQNAVNTVQQLQSMLSPGARRW